MNFVSTIFRMVVYVVAGYALAICALIVTGIVYRGLDYGAGVIRCVIDVSKCAN